MQSAGERARGAAIADASVGDVGSPVPPVRTGKSRGAGRWLLLLLGFATLGVLLWEVNTQDLLARFLALGWSAPLLLWPYALIALVDGWAYSFTLPRNGVRRPPLPALVMIRLAGESVNTLTPTAYLGGEPVKAMLLELNVTELANTMSTLLGSSEKGSLRPALAAFAAAHGLPVQ